MLLHTTEPSILDYIVSRQLMFTHNYFSLQKITRSAIKDEIQDSNIHKGYKKNEGRIFGGQFQDGISNAVDAMSMIRSEWNHG